MVERPRLVVVRPCLVVVRLSYAELSNDMVTFSIQCVGYV